MALRPDDLTIFEIAAGTGMLSTAVELACAAVGVRATTIGYCERDACAAASLVARMEGKTLHPAPIWDDAWTLDCQPWRGQVDLLCAGYPCQPFSSAGRRLGHRDPRHLWPAVRRAIARIEPGIVFLENVEGHVGKGAGKVLRDLHRLGYSVTAGLFSSAECGASHERQRLFILGVADDKRNGRSRDIGKQGASEESDAPNGRRVIADMPCQRRRQVRGRNAGKIGNGPTVTHLSGELGHANEHQQQSRPMEARHKRRKASGVGHSELPRYSFPRDIRLVAVAKALSGAESSDEARAVAADAGSLAEAIFGNWAAVAEMDPSRMPAIESALRGVADGLASWADQLRLSGPARGSKGCVEGSGDDATATLLRAL